MTLSSNFKNTLKNGSPTENWHSGREGVHMIQPDKRWVANSGGLALQLQIL
jgi:hypothetical protein